MNTLRLIAFSALCCWTPLSSAAEPETEISVVIRHEYYWEEFTVSKESPRTADGRYLLKRVQRNGEVELAYSVFPGQTEDVVVKPMPKKLKKDARPPTIVVLQFDAEKQSATIRELRMR